MKSILGLFLLALMLGVAGSASGQEPEQAPVQFWKTLGDSTLEQLVSTAVRSNQDLAGARARMRGARAARLDAALDFAPAITASASYTRQRLASAGFPFGGSSAFPDQNVWNAGLEMSWELDLFGRIRRTTQGQGALVAPAEEDVQDFQVLVATDLAAAYYGLRGAQDRLAVAQRNAQNQRRTLQLTLQRLDARRGNEVGSGIGPAPLDMVTAG